MNTNTPLSIVQKPRVFISYKRRAEPDESVVTQVVQSLRNSREAEVHIDRDIPLGAPWSKWIEDNIQGSDYFIVFLTANSIQSQAVTDEILLANSKHKANGRPKILPVKLGPGVDPSQIAYNVGMVLRPIQWAEWLGEQDTEGLLAKLRGAIGGQALTLSSRDLQLAVPSDAAAQMPAPALSAHCLRWKESLKRPDSHFYVERNDDSIALQALEQESGRTVNIKSSRKTGKSSLVAHAMEHADKLGLRQAWLDLGSIVNESVNETGQSDAGLFYQRFCEMITEELQDDDDLGGLENKVAEYWATAGSDVMLCTRYLKQHILKAVQKSEKPGLVLALDNVDQVANCNFRDGFFGMLRAWHNERAKPNNPWRKVYLLVATSTEPQQFIRNLNSSPFNVGESVGLDDFTPAEVAALNEKHGQPFSPAQLGQLQTLLNGQPYLTRRALYLVASEQWTVEELFAEAHQISGPFGDYLDSYESRLRDHEDLRKALRDIVFVGDTSDDAAAGRLEGLGLIKQSNKTQTMRCELYKQFFRERL